MPRDKFEDPEHGIGDFLFSTVENKVGLFVHEPTWTFVCFALAGVTMHNVR